MKKCNRIATQLAHSMIRVNVTIDCVLEKHPHMTIEYIVDFLDSVARNFPALRRPT